MLRGCQRNIVYVKSTDNKIFEEAYFLLRKGVTEGNTALSNSEMMQEVSGMLNTALPYMYPSMRKKCVKLKYALSFIAGALTCLAAFAVILAAA